MSQSFKIFLLVALSFFTSFNLSANDTFFSIEKSSDSINVVANTVDDIASTFPKLASKFDDWADLGLSFNKVDDVVKITAQNGDEVATVFKNGTDEIFEIADDFFVDAPINPATEITGITVKANTGETIIGGGFFKNADGSIGFVEDVSSYGSTIVQNAVKRRGNLRKSFSNIAKTDDAHHLFPVQSLKENQWIKKGVEGGFEFNLEAINGIAVKKYVKQLV